MPTKPKPRYWRCPDLNALVRADARVDSLPVDFNRIESILQEHGSKVSRAEIECTVRNIAAQLLVESEIEDQRPRVSERRAALERLNAIYKEEWRTLHNLDDDTARDLVSVLGRQGTVTHERRRAASLWWATRKAVAKLPKPDRTQHAMKRAVSRLADKWEDFTGSRPGRRNRLKPLRADGSGTMTEPYGPFAELAQLALCRSVPDYIMREGLALPPTSSWT
jgi:hypothetical protein